MNFTDFGTQSHIIEGYADHIVIAVIISILTPLFTHFGLKREIQIIEQIVAIILVLLTAELIIYLLPFMVNSIKSIF